MQNWVWLMNSAISVHQVTLECRCTNVSLSIKSQDLSELKQCQIS